MNSFAAGAVKQMVNATYLQPYGRLQELEIDSTNKTLFAVLELNGESQPLEIRVASYELAERGGEIFLELGKVTTSRAWLNTLLAEQLLDKVIGPKLQQMPLPSMVKMLL